MSRRLKNKNIKFQQIIPKFLQSAISQEEKRRKPFVSNIDNDSHSNQAVIKEKMMDDGSRKTSDFEKATVVNLDSIGKLNEKQELQLKEMVNNSQQKLFLSLQSKNVMNDQPSQLQSGLHAIEKKADDQKIIECSKKSNKSLQKIGKSKLSKKNSLQRKECSKQYLIPKQNQQRNKSLKRLKMNGSGDKITSDIPFKKRKMIDVHDCKYQKNVNKKSNVVLSFGHDSDSDV